MEERERSESGGLEGSEDDEEDMHNDDSSSTVDIVTTGTSLSIPKSYMSTDLQDLIPALKCGYSMHRYLIIWNISKKNNVKALIHIALGFGFVPVIVGLIEITKNLHLDNRLDNSKYIHFASYLHMLRYLEENSVKLIGIEIGDNSQSVEGNVLFQETHIAFMPGNEGSGLSSIQSKNAQGLLYIPQYGNGTASLNVTVATSIILNCYTNRFKYVS